MTYSICAALIDAKFIKQRLVEFQLWAMVGLPWCMRVGVTEQAGALDRLGTVPFPADPGQLPCSVWYLPRPNKPRPRDTRVLTGGFMFFFSMLFITLIEIFP